MVFNGGNWQSSAFVYDKLLQILAHGIYELLLDQFYDGPGLYVITK